MLILLGICINVDSADTTTINSTPTKVNVSQENISKINGTYYVLPKDNGKATSDGKIHQVKDKTQKEKKQYNTITMTGRPSCTRCARNGCSYTWRTKTYINYCPNCHHYKCLGNKHKRGAVHEQEISCFHCDSDFCVNCGKEKYSYSRVYLQKT